MKQIELAAIVFDASTQARAAIDEAVVADYAEKMLNGVVFPPVVLFHDGNQYYMGDGFHRGLAAQRNGSVTIPSDVRAGTRADALWFALGANKEHGARMTDADKAHAIALARQTWPERMQSEIAAQIGCHPSFVSRVYAKLTSSEPVDTGRKRATAEKRQAIAERLNSGVSANAIHKELGVSPNLVVDVKRSLGMRTLDTTSRAVQARRDRLREMAEQGFTSRQIAAELGISEAGCKDIAKKESIDVHADRVTGKLHRHDSNRIVEHMVMDAENLTADVNLIEFSALDAERLGEWIDSLNASRKSLGAFIQRLIKEQQKHGQAA